MATIISGRGGASGEGTVINEPERARSPLPRPIVRLPDAEARSQDARESAAPAKGQPLDGKLREGIRLFNARRWEDALHALMLVDSIGIPTEERIECSYYVGLCLAKMDRFTDAMPYIEKVIAAEGDMLRVYQCRMTLAYMHITTGRPKMAEYELSRLLDSGFESAMLFNALAYSAYQRRHYRHAIEYYEKALKIEEGNATALNSMGFILADTGIDPIKGLKLCRKAVEMQPDNPAYLDSLGWACYKCREPTAARSWLRKALALAPQESQIKEHLRVVSGGAL